MSFFDYYYFSFKDFKYIMLEQSDNKKRKGMNKNPHTNNYKQKIKKNRGRR